MKPQAQSYQEIGNGTTYGTWPAYYGAWGNYWYSCHTQTLYKASELGAGVSKIFTQLAWNFERVAPAGTNYHLNAYIRIKTTTLNSLPTGAYVDMTGATQVFYSPNFVPATSTGWQTIDITDYNWYGTDNLIVDVTTGSNSYYSSTYYRTYKTADAGGNVRTLIGYGDVVQPVSYSSSSTEYDNMRWYYVPLSLPGDIQGYVFNYYGLAISGASIGVTGFPPTTSGADGSYLLQDIPSTTWNVSCSKEGYNTAVASVYVPEGGVATQNFTLTQPNMVINPLYVEETLNPGEYYTFSMNVLNNGNGPLHWEAEIQYPDNSSEGGTTPPEEDQTVYPPNGNPSLAEVNGEPLDDDGTRNLMACPDGSIFSCPPQSSNNGFTSTLGTGYKVSQQFNNVTGAITQITFWGLYTSTPAASPTFKVDICQPGATPGAIVTTVTLPILAVNTGVPVIGYPTYVFTVAVPPTALTEGWVTVEQQTSSPTFYWMNTFAGAGLQCYQAGYGYRTERVCLCLAGGGGGAGSWLSMDYYEGDVPGFGGVDNVPTHMDAAGTEVGDVYTADIVFTSTPFVGEITVPVTMIIMGDELVAPENLEVTLANDVTGETHLTWEWNGDAFQFFLIKRDGTIVGTTTNLWYNDLLPDYGDYCYTVQAVYFE